MDIIRTSGELEELLGERLRELRLLKNLDQKTLAERAGVSLNAIKHLEIRQWCTCQFLNQGSPCARAERLAGDTSADRVH